MIMTTIEQRIERQFKITLCNGHRIKIKRLENILKLEELRWRLVNRAKQVYRRYLHAYHELIQRGGAHYQFKRGHWVLYSVEKIGDEFLISSELVSAPITPKCVAAGVAYHDTLNRYGKTRQWILIADAALLAALSESFKVASEQIKEKCVFNFNINGREYVTGCNIQIQAQTEVVYNHLSKIAFPDVRQEPTIYHINIADGKNVFNKFFDFKM
jgi:hypothetical protein